MQSRGSTGGDQGCSNTIGGGYARGRICGVFAAATRGRTSRCCARRARTAGGTWASAQRTIVLPGCSTGAGAGAAAAASMSSAFKTAASMAAAIRPPTAAPNHRSSPCGAHRLHQATGLRRSAQVTASQRPSTAVQKGSARRSRCPSRAASQARVWVWETSRPALPATNSPSLALNPPNRWPHKHLTRPTRLRQRPLPHAATPRRFVQGGCAENFAAEPCHCASPGAVLWENTRGIAL